MPWPNIRDFSNALLNPAVCFDDPELADGQVQLHPVWRTPIVWPGNFASVYKVAAPNGQNFAVRCFTREVRDHQSRYRQLSQYLQDTDPPGFVEFDYQPDGIRVGGHWYPIVKMDWVNGQTLDKFVEDHLSDSQALKSISNQWRNIAIQLQLLDAAHNDLQHGNIIVEPNESIRLVDYDGIYLPQFHGDSPEEGHANYQHPERSSRDYAPHIDNFPALVIHLSLLAIAADPDLWQHYHKDENLLFTRTDFARPQNSALFQTLKTNNDPAISNLAALLQDCCTRPVSETPTLETALQSTVIAAPTKTATPPMSYRELLQQRQQESKPKIYSQDFIRFCSLLDGQELRTLKKLAPFRIDVNQATSNLQFTPASSGQTRNCTLAELMRFLDRYESTNSWSTGDYLPSITNNASYLLVLLDYYLRFATQFPSIQDELQAARQQTDSDPEQNPQEAQAQLQAARQQIADTEQKLQAAQAELATTKQQAAADNAEADRKLQTAHSELESAKQQAAADNAEADQKLQDAHAELEAIKQQAAADNAEAEQKFYAIQAQLQDALAELENHRNSWLPGKFKR